MIIQTLLRFRTRLCLVTAFKSITDTTRWGVKQHIDFSDRKAKINFDLIYVGSRNAKNSTFQPAKPMPN